MKKLFIKNIGAALLLLGLVQSCKVTRDYSRPELNLPGTFDHLPVKTEKKVQEIPSYQQYFNDPLLKEILDRVMARNSDLQIAAEQMLAAEAMLKSVKLNYLPDINLQVNAGVQRLSKNSMVGSFAGGLIFQEYNFAPSVSWDIDFWGKLKRQREEAISGYLGLAENRRALRVQLIAQTAQVYYDLLSLDEQLRITQTVENSMMGSFAGGLIFQEYNFAPSVSWDIDFWGKLKRQREEAMSGYLGLAENRRALRVQLIAQTAQAYYDLLSLDEQLRITQTVEKSMQETLEMLKTQYAVGDATSLAIKQSEAQLAETRALIPEIKASIKAQENALQTLAGTYPGAVKRAQPLQDKSFSTELEAGVPMDLLANRPDIKQKEFELQAANARVGIARTEFYPTLKITGQGGLNAIKASNWFSVPASLFGNAAAGLTQPIFNKRSIRSAYEQALHQREAAVHDFRKSVLMGVEEVSTSLSNITHIKEQMTEVNNRKTAMNKAIADAQILYKYGEANYLEVLTVQQSYLQAALAHTLVIQKETNAYIALYKSLGGN